MNNTIFRFEVPANEPAATYAPGTPERAALKAELARMEGAPVEIPLIIGGREVRTGRLGRVVKPSEHGRVLATYHQATAREVGLAIEAARSAREAWATMSWVERASIMLKAAELLSRKYRAGLNAATMLGQSKTVQQAEIDAACETIDYLRYNTYFASRIYADQPRSGFDQLNRMEYRPLEGFVLAVTPFNFTAIASNLNLSVALMGNTTVWKPASASLLSSWGLMQLYREAGLPDGVVNFVPGAGSVVGGAALAHPELAAIHFTGSNATFEALWRGVTEHLAIYRAYPRLVGETGGKDFVFVHASADPDEVATAIVRGAFEYQGQKCSAASRAYVPRSLWRRVRDGLADRVRQIKVGDVTDFSSFMGAVIDEAAFDRILGYVARARAEPGVEVLAGGGGDKAVGWFVEPTVLVTRDPRIEAMREEIFGPVMTVHVYEDADWEATLRLCDETSPYGLTGAVFARDRSAFVQACRVLRYAAGNFYLNDKPTGALVGLQPFGGARRSGTNDKAGGSFNLLRWVSPRTIKETFVPARAIDYPHQREP